MESQLSTVCLFIRFYSHILNISKMNRNARPKPLSFSNRWMILKSTMTSGVSVSKITFCDPCLFEKSSTEATGFCVDCVETLCSQCIKYHAKNKASRSHAVLKVITDQSKNTFFGFLKDALMCKVHPD